MIAVIVDNHAHRLLNNGLVESALIQKENDNTVVFIDERDWKIVSPEKDLGITGGDFYMIKKQLEMLHALFPDGRNGLPVIGEVENEQVDPNSPRK